MSEPNRSVGANIRRFRVERGMSASELAEAADVSKSYISALEGETERRPSADVLYRIASALGVAMSDLLGRPIITAPTSERPASLLEFARAEGLPEADVAMLAGIAFRGDPPRTPERWRFIYDAIRNSRTMDGGTDSDG